MKKLLCIFLSLVMMLSMATVAFAADSDEEKDLYQTLAEKIADDAYLDAFNGKTLDITSGQDYDAKLRRQDTDLFNKQFLGMKIGYLYSRDTYPLEWGHLDVTKSDMANFWGDLNTLLVTILKNYYTNYKDLCTSKHATAICNFVGHLLDPDFQDKNINFGSDYVTKKEFYERIGDESDLDKAIINGWLNTKTVDGVTSYTLKSDLDYYPFVRSFLEVPIFYQNGSSAGSDVFEFFEVPSKEYLIPKQFAGYIIKSVIENAINEGPIQYLLNMLRRLVKDYDGKFLDAIAGLLKAKMQNAGITKQQLTNYDVLFNLLANNNNKDDQNHLQFILFPAYQFSKAADNTEAFLYLMTYTNLLGKHKSNDRVAESWETAIRNCKDINSGQAKEYMACSIEGMFRGNLTKLATEMREIAEYNLSHIGRTWGWNFKDFFANLYRSIALFFDGIFKTLKNGINLRVG